MSERLERTKYLRDLRRTMQAHFDLEELEVIAFDSSVDWDELSGKTKPTKIQNLIMHLARRGRLEELVTLLREERPKVEWPYLPPPDQQTKDEQSVTPDPLNDYFDKLTTIKNDPEPLARAKIGLYTDELLSKLEAKESKDKLILAVKYFSDAKLSDEIELSLAGFDLSGVRLSNTYLRDINMSKADLSGTDLRRAKLSWTNLSNANLSNANLIGANLSWANLKETNLSEANLTVANLRSADLSGAHLSGANLSGAMLSDTNLSNADLHEANLSEVELRRANLHESKLEGADLGGAQYDCDTKWPESFNYRTSGAIGPDAKLTDADLSGANLYWSDLRRADLGGVNLSEANLSEANLSEANLNGADLSRTNLNNANLHSANLSGANLSGANLREADIGFADLHETKYTNATIWPLDSKRAFSYGILVDDEGNPIKRPKHED